MTQQAAGFNPSEWVGASHIETSALDALKHTRLRAALATYIGICSRAAGAGVPGTVLTALQDGRQVVASLPMPVLSLMFECPVAVWCIETCAHLLANALNATSATTTSGEIESWLEAIGHLNRVILGGAWMHGLEAELDCITDEGFVHLQPQGISVPAAAGRPKVRISADGSVDAGFGPWRQEMIKDDPARSRRATRLMPRSMLRVDPFDPLLRRRWVEETSFPQGIAARCVDAEALAGWLTRAADAFSALQRLWPGMADEILHLQSMLVPVLAPPNGLSISLSSDAFWGAILVSDADEVLFNESLVHEHSHNVMYGLLRHHTFLVSGGFDGERHYSPWRPDARPIYGLLHAVYVFSRVCEYYARLVRSHLGDLRLVERLALLQSRVEIGCLVLRASGDLTLTGSELVDAIEANATRLQELCREARPAIIHARLREHIDSWRQTHPDLALARGVLDYVDRRGALCLAPGERPETSHER
jgi:HEXXH motif-containing protein